MKIVKFNTGRLDALLDDSSVIDLNHAYSAYKGSKGAKRPYAMADASVPACPYDLILEGGDAIEEAKTDDHELDVELAVNPGNLVSVAPADSPLVKGIQAAAEKVVGFTPQPVGGSHRSDHGWVVARHGKPFVSYGTEDKAYTQPTNESKSRMLSRQPRYTH